MFFSSYDADSVFFDIFSLFIKLVSGFKSGGVVFFAFLSIELLKERLDKSFKLFVELLEDDTSYDNIILGAVNHDDTLEQLKGTGLKIVNL